MPKKSDETPRGSREGKMVPKVKKVAKTGAERSREYRARVKALENAVIAGSVTSGQNDAFQHMLGDNLSDMRPRSLLYEALSRQSRQGTQETEDNYRQFVVQVDVHQQDLSAEAPSTSAMHMPPSTDNMSTVSRKSKKAKTSAERVRAHRQRKNALKNTSNQQSMVDAAKSHVDDIPVLEDQPQEIINVETATVRARKRPYTSEP